MAVVPQDRVPLITFWYPIFIYLTREGHVLVHTEGSGVRVYINSYKYI